MIIQFKKHRSKANTLSCIRADGSLTWTSMYPGIEAHDLGHYAVETTMKFQNAFYGLVAKGSNIEDFELPREERPTEVVPDNLSAEALISEHLVNLLMVKAQQPEAIRLLPSLQKILKDNAIPFPTTLNEQKMTEIWELFLKLLQQWQTLAVGEILELEFGKLS